MIQIEWTPHAKQQAIDALDYCVEHFGLQIADRFAKSFEKDEKRLSENILLGFPEPLLMHRTKLYRSIVEGIYKIIYYVDIDNSIIYIVSLWDCRQDTSQLEKQIK